MKFVDLQNQKLKSQYSRQRKSRSKNRAVARGFVFFSLAIFGIAILFFRNFNSSEARSEKKRNNTIALAKKHIDKERYDNAINILNSLLHENTSDKEADALLQKAIELQKQSVVLVATGAEADIVVEAASGEDSATGEAAIEKATIEEPAIDEAALVIANEEKDALSQNERQERLQKILARREADRLVAVQEHLARQEARLAQERAAQERLAQEQQRREEIARREREVEERQRAEEARLAQERAAQERAAQEQQRREEIARREREAEERQRAEEARLAQERAAQERAAQEQQRREEIARREREAEERQRAEEARLAQEKLNGINDRILAGKSYLVLGDIDGALDSFAVASLQLSLQDKEFSRAKYSEMTSALYEASQNETDGTRRQTLKNAASAYARKTLAENQSDAVARYVLGMEGIERGDWHGAQRELVLAVRANSANADYHYNLGRTHFALGNLQDARASFENAIKNDARHDSAYYSLGMTQKRLGLANDALKSFRTSRQINSRNALAHFEEARLLSGNFSDLNGAREAYNKFIALEPTNYEALTECASICARLGRHNEAERLYRRAIALLKPDESAPLLHHNLAETLLMQRKYSDARLNARTAHLQMDGLLRSSDKAMIAYNYARIEDELGNRAAAIALYKETLDFDPANENALTRLGIVYMNMSPPEIDTALSFFMQAYSRNKSFELENNIARAYFVKKDYAKAATHFENALAKNPRDNTVRFNLARAYLNGSDFENAKAAYIEVLNRDENNLDAYIELAKVLIKLKDNSSASEYLKALQEKNPAYKRSEVEELLATTG